MFDAFFEKKSSIVPSTTVLRGILPTYVTSEVLVLSKASPVLRDAYEIKLALYMARSKALQFILLVKPDTKIAPSILTVIEENYGKVEFFEVTDYSVYVGSTKSSGEENGWVLGNSANHEKLCRSIKSDWMKKHLRLGSQIAFADLDRAANELSKEVIDVKNIDGENVHTALLSLIEAAKEHEGELFVQ